MAESHQPPPYTHMQQQQHLPPPPYQQQQQQQGMTAWYPSPAAPAPYHHYQVPLQAPNPQWPLSGPPPPPPPPGDQSFVYVQQQQQPLQYHHPQGGDFYHHQQPQQYSLTPQPASSQFTYMYGQQDQVWQANGNWGYQPWSYPAQNPSLTQEEVWAAKARAWAASKAAQNESRPAQPGAVTPQTYQDYAHKREPQALESDDGQPYSVQSTAQEAGPVVQNQSISNQGQSAPIKPSDQLTQGMTSLDHRTHEITQPLEPLEQNTVSETGQAQLSDRQSVSSSYVGDSTSSFGIDGAITGPPGTDRLDFTSQGTLQPSVTPPFNQQPTSLITQSQASPNVSLPRFTYPEQPTTLGYELHHQHQVPPSYSQPQQQLTPHSQSLPQIQLPLPQTQPVQQQHPQVQPQPQLQQPQPPQFQSTAMMENVEAEFGLSPASLQSWAPIGGPGMPFPPAIGAGTSQISVPVFGMSQGLAFPSGSPYIANPGLGPGPGASVRPPFLPDGFVERPKKAAVPSWLREELMKKKAAGLAGKSSGMLLSDESNRVNGGEPATPLNQRLGISDRVRSKTPGLSDDEEDNHEEELEAARNAAINQEIKRLLTDVLLKVTADLFEEIAQEVLDEDDDEILQEKLSMNGQERTHRVTTSPVPAPASGRVLVSSQKIPAATEDDKDSEDSGGGAGNVLGLGDYASDDDNTRGTEEVDQEDLDDTNQAQLTKDATRHEVIEKYNGSADHHADSDNDDTYQTRGAAKGQDNNAEEYRVRRHEQEGGKKRMREDESLQASTSVKDYPVDTSNGKAKSSRHIEGATLEGEVDLPKGEPHRSSAASSKENHASREAHNTKCDDRDKPPLGKDSHGGSGKSGLDKARVKEITNEALNDRKLSDLPTKEKIKEERTLGDEPRDREVKDQKLSNIHPKEKKRDDRTKELLDISRKEKKVEERYRDSARRKGNDVQRSERGSNAGERDSSRGRRKEKVKDRAKSRDKDYHQDRRHDKKGSKRIDSQEKRTRRHSSSSSSGPSRSSSPYSSDNSRGRSHALRAGRHRSSLASPGRSRKRRVSRSHSRSRSPSPHARHSHRRNAPSPFHEKSRRSPSHSPIHRRHHS